MSSSDPDADRRSPLVILRRAEQPFVALLIGIGLLTLLLHCCRRFQRQDRLIEIDRAPPLHTEFQVDINTAGWPEIVVLPGIGESTARDIIAERERGGPFTDLEQLIERVRGVGPRMIEEIQPFVLPIVPPDSVAEANQNAEPP